MPKEIKLCNYFIMESLYEHANWLQPSCLAEGFILVWECSCECQRGQVGPLTSLSPYLSEAAQNPTTPSQTSSGVQTVKALCQESRDKDNPLNSNPVSIYQNLYLKITLKGPLKLFIIGSSPLYLKTNRLLCHSFLKT